jgi:hypothetical protein
MVERVETVKYVVERGLHWWSVLRARGWHMGVMLTRPLWTRICLDAP